MWWNNSEVHELWLLQNAGLLHLRASECSSRHILVSWRHLFILHVKVYIWEWFDWTSLYKCSRSESIHFEHPFLTIIWSHTVRAFSYIYQPIILPKEEWLITCVCFLSGYLLGFYLGRSHMIDGLTCQKLLDKIMLSVYSSLTAKSWAAFTY